MSMDSSYFPFVWIGFEQAPGHDLQRNFDGFERNLKRGESFVLLSESAPAEGHEHTQEEKKRTSLWMKKHKAALRRLVLAMIMIEPNVAKRIGYKAFAVTFAKFWGYPLVLASSREEAMEIAERLLLEGRKSAPP